MLDAALLRDILRRILWSTQTIAKRFEPIQSPADFTSSDQGLEKLDAICMQLIAIGEAVKHLDKVSGGSLLASYPHVQWKRIIQPNGIPQSRDLAPRADQSGLL